MAKQVTWDAEADRKLFLTILKVNDVSIDYEAVAAEFSTPDISVTTNAIQKRLGKLRAMVGVSGLAAGAKKGRKRTTDDAAMPTEGKSETKKSKTTKVKNEELVVYKNELSEEDGTAIAGA